MFHSFHQRVRLGFKVCTFRRLITHALPRKKKKTTTTRNLDKLPALWAHSSWRTRVGIDCPQWRPNNGRNCLSFYLCNQRLMQACNCWPFQRERERDRVGCPFNLINIPNTNTGKQMHVTNGFNLCSHFPLSPFPIPNSSPKLWLNKN